MNRANMTQKEILNTLQQKGKTTGPNYRPNFTMPLENPPVPANPQPNWQFWTAPKQLPSTNVYTQPNFTMGEGYYNAPSNVGRGNIAGFLPGPTDNAASKIQPELDVLYGNNKNISPQDWKAIFEKKASEAKNATGQFIDKTKQAAKDIDNLFRGKASDYKKMLEEKSKYTVTKGQEFLDKGGKAAGEITKKVAQKPGVVGKVVGTVGKVAGRAAGAIAAPIAVGSMIYDAANLVDAGMNLNKAKNIEKEEKAIRDKFNALQAQGYDKTTAWQMANGLPVQEIKDPELLELERRKAETDAELARQQKLTDEAKARMEDAQRGVNELKAALGTNNQPQVTSSQKPLVDANTQGVAVPPEPNVQAQQVTTQPAIQDYANILNEVSKGNMSAQDIYNLLNTSYGNIENIINNDPRYQGDIVQAQNPRNIDIDQYRKAQAQQIANNKLAYMLGEDYIPEDQLLAQQADALYKQQMANQLGVPYEDYINATTQRNAEAIKLEADKAVNALKLYANQTTDMNQKLQYLQAAQKIQADADAKIQQEYIKGDFDLKKQALANTGSENVAMINQTGGITQERMKLEDPATQLSRLGMGAYNLAMSGRENLIQLATVSPTIRRLLFGNENIEQKEIIRLLQGMGEPESQSLFARLVAILQNGGNQ